VPPKEQKANTINRKIYGHFAGALRFLQEYSLENLIFDKECSEARHGILARDRSKRREAGENSAFGHLFINRLFSLYEIFIGARCRRTNLPDPLPTTDTRWRA
jgi:hypothetical protein